MASGTISTDISSKNTNGIEGGFIIKRHFLLTICILLMFAVLSGCSSSENKGSSFVATVLENNGNSLLVEPREGSDELRSADKIVVYVKDAKLIGEDSKEINMEDITVGTQVEISYDGAIAESYPAQIRGCYKIKVLG